MQSDQQLFPPNPTFPISPISNQVGGSYMHSAPNASAFGGPILPTGLKHSGAIHGIAFQPSELCPKNFIIFDQSQNRSQIMFHPVIAPQFCYPGFNIPSSYIHDNVEREANTEKEAPSSLRENLADIDALLSLEEEEQEECDEEEVSTARTHRNYGSDSSDSCSSYGSKPKKSRLSSSQKSSGSGNSCSERKRQKMRKMVKVLQGIVPDGNRMNTVAVLDEAVKYLKSLKIEAQKLGVTNLP
ncbi:Transcription factor bHLH144 like [Actinidia chinensis var. chinensis]|uniref:Transcription factor bHLH144 like n=1 Tax=Actinidia chinensis var. chinensis TaxID=1590841 RepID=A0A2R6PY46_ACTCC|nr:Transcription factor bHLH144 like [Actinidia chinensis var. chinensis]